MTQKGLIIGFFLLFSAVNSSFSQTKLRVEGLKDNVEYLEFINQQNNLTQKQDSIVKIIDLKKDSLQGLAVTDQARGSITDEILNLEGTLFEIRSELGIISTKTASIEQEYILANMGSGNNPIASVDNNDDITTKNILTAAKVRNELSDEEFEILSRIKGVDTKIKDSFAQISKEKVLLDTIFAKYSATGDKLLGDSLALVFDSISSVVANIDSKATERWTEIYDTKIYVYSRLLDKFGAERHTMDILNEKSRNSRSEESDIDLRYLAPNISKSTRQRSLTQEYEKSLATLLGMDSALDSINSEQKNLNIKKFDIEKHALPVQEMIIFTPIERITAKAHNDGNPPQDITIPSKGELHKVELGTYSKKLTSYASFYRVSPVEYFEMEDGKYRYWAGSYRTLEEATAASKMLNRLGMRTKVASWKNGENVDDASLSVGDYKIDLDNYTTTIRSIVEKEGKDISRSVDEDGETVFSVGIFSTRGEAVRVAELIGDGATVKPIK